MADLDLDIGGGKTKRASGNEKGQLINDGLGPMPSSIGNIKSSTTAPSAGTAVEAFASGSVGLIIKNHSSVAAEYIIIGLGSSEVEAETNRDAGQLTVLASSVERIRRDSNVTHYAWKSASGTPSAYIGQV